MGWVNLISSFVFRDRKAGITARQVRAHGAVAASKTPSMSHGESIDLSHLSKPERVRVHLENSRDV